MVLIRSWVDIKEGRGERSAYCVMMNVRVLVMFCGIVQARRLTYYWGGSCNKNLGLYTFTNNICST